MATQPYLVAMQHMEWKAKEVLKKHARNRPLGKLEKDSNYTPPQPVLSCRTVDIDHSGTRTYRSRNNSDIIEEQHRLIHDIYSKARNVSTPSTPSRPRDSTDGGGRTLRSLQVEGQGQRPFTSQGTVRTPSRQSHLDPPEAVLTRRPYTTAGGKRSKKCKAATDSHLVLLSDPNIQESSACLHDSQAALKDQWKSESHSLDQGKFVRGKKPESGACLDPRSRYQWLGFGGGQREGSGGVIDAFTRVSRPEFYAIDNNTGTQVSRQLRKGDKIQIGINGLVSPLEWKNKNYTMDNRLSSQDNMVPLCWEDELNHSEAKVLSPRAPKQSPPKPNLCETTPVYVNKPAKDNAGDLTQKKGTGKSRYLVSIENRSRRGVHGREAHAPITSINIAPRAPSPSPTPDPDMLDVSFDEILESRIPGRSLKLEDSQITLIANVKGNVDRRESPKEEEEVEEEVEEEEECDSVTEEVAALVNGTTSVPLTVPPSRAGLTSSASTRGELDHLLVAASTTHNPSPDRTRPHRVHSAGRPPLIKTLTKSNNIKNNKDAEYIQISQQLQVKSVSGGEATEEVPVHDIDGMNTPISSAIHSVSESNKPKTQPPGSANQRQPPVYNVEDTGNPPSPAPSPVLDDEEEEEESDREDINYAFNIPTAGVSESEVNSLADLGESSQTRNLPEVANQAET